MHNPPADSSSGVPPATQPDDLAIWRAFRQLGYAVMWHPASGTFDAKSTRGEPQICGHARSLSDVLDALRESGRVAPGESP